MQLRTFIRANITLFLGVLLTAWSFWAESPVFSQGSPNMGTQSHDNGSFGQDFGNGNMYSAPEGQKMYQQGGPGYASAPWAQQPGVPNSYYAGQAPSTKPVNPQQAARVYQWFLQYDEVRRRAQMNPIEKQQADGLLARGLGLFMPGQDKLAAKQLLSGLVMRYQTASRSLQGISPLPETRQLQESYFQYFDNAMHLFSDYLKVQDNVFAVDNTGQSIAKQLIQRKIALESLEHQCKQIDWQLRQQYGVAPYQF